jgi:hypothetical protein
MAGVTFSEPGNWTSWPPHEHAVLAEEAYLYINMPAPAFGVQLVYTNPREPELATIVREGDVVLMPQGYHPNVASPGGAILPLDDGGGPAKTSIASLASSTFNLNLLPAVLAGSRQGGRNERSRYGPGVSARGLGVAAH